MAFRTNYRFERAERDRAKKAKKEEKLKRRQDRDEVPPPAESTETSPENARPDE